MQYIYHRVPKNLIGSKLIPLFGLKKPFPELYKEAICKYDDHPKRKLLPYMEIKELGCKRGDILNFSPLSPYKIFQDYSFIFPDKTPEMNFFKIPINHIIGIPAVIYDMNIGGNYKFGDDDADLYYQKLSINGYKELQNNPTENIEFYQKMRAAGKRKAPLFARLPHVMVQGEVDISSCEIINWKNTT